MKNLVQMLKVLMINTIIFSLIQTPFISQAYADAEKSKSGVGANDILNYTGGALNIYGNYLGQKQQMMQQQMNSAKNQQLMSQMSPGCRKPDGSPCYATQAKYFPECNLPASITAKPQNICTNPTPDVGQISTNMTYAEIATSWEDYYQKKANEASNEKFPSGIRCLKDKQKAMDSQLTEMVNKLQTLQDKMNQEKQIFRDNNKKLLEDMNTSNDELFGTAEGVSKKNLDIKTKDFAKYFSPSCQSVIGKENLKSGSQNGLNGILQGLSSTNKSAADFNLNKSVIEDDVRREAGKIMTSINGGGVDDWLANASTANNIKSKSFPAIEAAVQKQATELGTARTRIKKELDAVGYTPPAMDKNFSIDMNDFNSGSAEFFKKKYVNDCVTGASSGVAIPIDDVLKSLQQKSTNSSGTARDDYRIALKKILDSEAMMDDKMASIKDLQNLYPGITVTYKDSSQARVEENPYDLFMKTIDKCQQKYTQDDQFSSKGSSGVSYQKKVERARAALQELKNLNDTFSSKVTQAISEQVLNCNGEGAKAGSDSCNEDSLKTTSDNFCVAHASTCANNIQGCYAEANTQVQAKKTKMENIAKAFNKNVAAMVAHSNFLYEQQKLAVTNITQLIQNKFPGTNFEIPKDMFVPMPEMSKDKYGVEMAGDGDMKSFLDGPNSLPEKIKLLQSMLKSQQTKVHDEIGDYITLQTTAIGEQQKFWGDLKTTCAQAVKKSQDGLNAQNNEGQKRQSEEDANVAKYCRKFGNIRDNPVGGCGKAKDLSDLADKISSRINNQTLAISEQYAAACDGFNNESDSTNIDCSDIESKSEKALCIRKQNAALDKKGSSSSPKSKKINFKSLCGSDGGNSDEKFIENVSKILTKKDQDALNSVKTISDASEKDLEDSAFDGVAGLKKDSAASSLCKDLYDNSNPTQLMADGADKTAETAKQTAQTKQTEAQTALIAAKAITPADKTKVDAADKAATEAQKALETATEAVDTAKRNLKLKTFLANLSDIKDSQTPTQDDLKLSKLSDLGEQMTESCDLQSNSNVPKSTDFLSNFDKQYLGTAR